MLAKVCSAAVNDIEAYPVEVEVNAGYRDTLLVIVVNNTPEAILGPIFDGLVRVLAIPAKLVAQIVVV